MRERGGYLFFDDFSLIEVAGKDACSFLQGRTSNDVKAIENGHGQVSSFLDRKGYLISFLSIHRLDDRYLLLSDRAQAPTLMKELTTYHFREQISYKEIQNEYALLLVQGALADSFVVNNFSKVLGAENSIAFSQTFGADCLIVRKSLCGDPGFFIFVPVSQLDGFGARFESAAKQFQLAHISKQALDVLRIEAGIPLFGKDISPEHLLPETGLEQSAASYNKGCFQGQEVLARIKTYGAPRRALVGLEFETDVPGKFALDTAFSVKNEDAGQLKSNCFSATLNRFIAMAFISRDYRLPEHRISISCLGQSFPVKVKFLPFYTAVEAKGKAKALYDKALHEFAYGSEKKAIQLLRDVIDLDPLFIDAYESLGVILSRHQQLDEAIALMHRLMELDPDSIMAHTNLSIYYMQQGNIEKAEEEKAISMSIRMAQLAKEAVAQKKMDEDKAKLAEEAEKRLDMFRQVLAIDDNDLLANNGIGTIYVELGKFEEALPFLHKAIAIKPTHTVAYVALGKAYESLGQIDNAVKIYNSGIEVAAKRGDITPMKEMQGLLSALSHAR